MSCSPRVPVGKRSNCTKVQSKGFFPGAKVTRGRDWKWGEQDGGNGRVGILTEICAWSGIERAGAKVTWNVLSKNTYRTGHMGSVGITEVYIIIFLKWCSLVVLVIHAGGLFRIRFKPEILLYICITFGFEMSSGCS